MTMSYIESIYMFEFVHVLYILIYTLQIQSSSRMHF